MIPGSGGQGRQGAGRDDPIGHCRTPVSSRIRVINPGLCDAEGADAQPAPDVATFYRVSRPSTDKDGSLCRSTSLWRTARDGDSGRAGRLLPF